MLIELVRQFALEVQVRVASDGLFLLVLEYEMTILDRVLLLSLVVGRGGGGALVGEDAEEELGAEGVGLDESVGVRVVQRQSDVSWTMSVKIDWR